MRQSVQPQWCVVQFMWRAEGLLWQCFAAERTILSKKLPFSILRQVSEKTEGWAHGISIRAALVCNNTSEEAQTSRSRATSGGNGLGPIPHERPNKHFAKNPKQVQEKNQQLEPETKNPKQNCVGQKRFKI